MARQKTTTVPLSPLALRLRVKRHLAARGQALHSTRPTARAREALGDYYVIEGRKVAATHVDLMKLAHELGCVRPWEELQP